MLKYNVNKGHLLLGLLFLLQRKPKAVRGDTSPACTAYECTYDSLPPILGKAEANFAPLKTCYNDQERVYVICTEDLRGPPYNLCTAGYWLYPFGPTCEDITLCYKTNVPNHGSIHPDEAFFDLYEIIYYSCHDNYSLVGPSEAVCESGGVWNPPTVPTCKAQCSRKVIPNSDSSSSSPPIHHGDVLIVTCNEGYSGGQGNSTTSGCSNGTFSPPLPSCYADCKSLTNPDYGEVVIGSNPYSHREVAVFECNENYTLVGNEEIYCYDGLWGNDPPVCMAPCSMPVIPNSDAISPNPYVPHGTAITVTCNGGYTNGDTARTTIICNDGTISPDETKCIETKMESQDVAAIVFGVVGAAGGIVAPIVGLIRKKRKKKKEQQRIEQRRVEQQRIEQRRVEQRRVEQQRIDQEQIEQQQIAYLALEQQRVAYLALEQQRVALEQQRVAYLALEQQRVALEQQRVDEDRQRAANAETKARQRKFNDAEEIKRTAAKVGVTASFAVAGAIIGLIAGPLGIAIGAAVGAGVGAVAGGVSDSIATLRTVMIQWLRNLHNCQL